MPNLSNATLVIANVPNTSNVKITAKVNVKFTAQEKIFIDQLNAKFRLRCKIWGKDEGEDSGTTGDNDVLDIPEKGLWISGDTTEDFVWESVSSNTLDEDNFFQDEIIARFTCAPQNTGLLIFSAAKPRFSNTVRGSF